MIIMTKKRSTQKNALRSIKEIQETEIMIESDETDPIDSKDKDPEKSIMISREDKKTDIAITDDFIHN